MARPWPEDEHASAADLAHCREAIRVGSRSFHAASRFLPYRVAGPALALYAFCRASDDAIDTSDSPSVALTGLLERLDALYAGRPGAHACDRAFADVVSRFAIPRALPAALLEGFAWDAAGRRYEDLDGVLDYSARVAGTVGGMMTLLMGVRDEHVLARACDLGVAMQLTNIARDVGEDARAGRLYLPLQWMRAAGLDPVAWLRAPEFSPALASVVRRLLIEAQTLYVRAESGIAGLPEDCRAAILAARVLYARIGDEVERQGFDSVSRRAVVPWTRKLVELARGITSTPLPATVDRVRPLPQTQFLVDAVCTAQSPATVGTLTATPWWNLRERLIETIDFFERLERREQTRAVLGSAARGRS